MKSKTYLFLFILLPALCCVAAVCYSQSQKEPISTIPAATEADRTAWLASQGWHAVCISSRAVTIPDAVANLDDANQNYQIYVTLQEKQHLPLQDYAGAQGIVYTYQLEDNPCYAELLTADGVLIGAQCYDPEAGIPLDIQGKPTAR